MHESPEWQVTHFQGKEEGEEVVQGGGDEEEDEGEGAEEAFCD